jgi:hypothetical protein
VAIEIPDASSINTTTGVVTTPAGPLTVSAVVTQPGAPSIRVFAR